MRGLEASQCRTRHAHYTLAADLRQLLLHFEPVMSGLDGLRVVHLVQSSRNPVAGPAGVEEATAAGGLEAAK
jgi:hypothetical protein